MDMRDIAITVRQAPNRRFGWVMFEGTGEEGPFASYARIQESEESYESYLAALAAAVVALRALGGPGGPQRAGSWWG